jgi:hypothetical protein
MSWLTTESGVIEHAAEGRGMPAFDDDPTYDCEVKQDGKQL